MPKPGQNSRSEADKDCRTGAGLVVNHSSARLTASSAPLEGGDLLGEGGEGVERGETLF